MRAVVFAGPTLAGATVKEGPDFIFLPPAAHGDIYRAALGSPKAIGLIDGFFETVPAVWHKEILFALSEGVHVFGAASMGALRAAELWQFGMVGIGAVFEAYRDNRIEDDDEVAIVHGPAELDYLPLTEAMVNVRATVEAAVKASILGAAAADAILRLAKAMFYKERTWSAILAAAARSGIPSPACEAFRVWLPGGAVDLKRADAHWMLEEVGFLLRSGRGRFQADFEFQETLDWKRALRVFRDAPDA